MCVCVRGYTKSPCLPAICFQFFLNSTRRSQGGESLRKAETLASLSVHCRRAPPHPQSLFPSLQAVGTLNTEVWPWLLVCRESWLIPSLPSLFPAHTPALGPSLLWETQLLCVFISSLTILTWHKWLSFGDSGGTERQRMQTAGRGRCPSITSSPRPGARSVREGSCSPS